MASIIDSVYMGCDISIEDEEFVKEICRKSDSKIKLYKAQKAFYKYEIEFNQVDY